MCRRSWEMWFGQKHTRYSILFDKTAKICKNIWNGSSDYWNIGILRAILDSLWNTADAAYARHPPVYPSNHYGHPPPHMHDVDGLHAPYLLIILVGSRGSSRNRYNPTIPDFFVLRHHNSFNMWIRRYRCHLQIINTRCRCWSHSESSTSKYPGRCLGRATGHHLFAIRWLVVLLIYYSEDSGFAHHWCHQRWRVCCSDVGSHGEPDCQVWKDAS